MHAFSIQFHRTIPILQQQPKSFLYMDYGQHQCRIYISIFTVRTQENKILHAIKSPHLIRKRNRINLNRSKCEYDGGNKERNLRRWRNWSEKLGLFFLMQDSWKGTYTYSNDSRGRDYRVLRATEPAQPAFTVPIIYLLPAAEGYVHGSIGGRFYFSFDLCRYQVRFSVLNTESSVQIETNFSNRGEVTKIKRLGDF